MKPANRDEALALLRDIGAPPRLYRHAELVGEAADLLLTGLKRFGVQVGSGDHRRVADRSVFRLTATSLRNLCVLCDSAV